MTTLLITHPASLEHSNGPGHPERPDRIRAIEKILAQDLFSTDDVQERHYPCHVMTFIWFPVRNSSGGNFLSVCTKYE